MLERLTPARRNLALLLLLALALWFAWTVRAALNPLLIAFLVAYMLHPMVLSLERRGWSRRRAVHLIYGITAILVLLGSAGLYLQGRALWRDLVREDGLLPRIEQRTLAAVERAESGLREWLPDVFPPESPAEGPDQAEPGERPEPSTLRALLSDLRAWLQSGEGLSAARQASTAAAGGLLSLGARLFGSLLTFLTLVLLVPIYTWFLLFELERIANWVKDYVPIAQRERVGRIGEQVAEVLGSFFRGRLLVCLLKGLLLSGLLALLGVPYAFLLGMLAGALSLVPFLGPLIGYALVFLLALTMRTEAPDEAASALQSAPIVPLWGATWRTLVVFAVGELVEGYVLLPFILGDSLGLHPLVVLVSLTVGGVSLGMFGLLIALPLTAMVIIVARELVLPAARAWAQGNLAPPAGR